MYFYTLREVLCSMIKYNFLLPYQVWSWQLYTAVHRCQLKLCWKINYCVADFFLIRFKPVDRHYFSDKARGEILNFYICVFFQESGSPPSLSRLGTIWEMAAVKLRVYLETDFYLICFSHYLSVFSVLFTTLIMFLGTQKK